MLKWMTKILSTKIICKQRGNSIQRLRVQAVLMRMASPYLEMSYPGLKTQTQVTISGVWSRTTLAKIYPKSHFLSTWMTQLPFSKSRCRVANTPTFSIKPRKRKTRCVESQWLEFTKWVVLALSKEQSLNRSTLCSERHLNLLMTTSNTSQSKSATTHLSLPHTFVEKAGATFATPRSISTSTESSFQSTSSLRLISIWRNLMKLLNCQHQLSASIIWSLCPWWAPCTTISAIHYML